MGTASVAFSPCQRFKSVSDTHEPRKSHPKTGNACIAVSTVYDCALM